MRKAGQGRDKIEEEGINRQVWIREDRSREGRDEEDRSREGRSREGRDEEGRSRKGRSREDRNEADRSREGRGRGDMNQDIDGQKRGKIRGRLCRKGERPEGQMADGSFTVEAALLMTVIIPVLIALIYAGFYIHDREVLQGMACEITAMGSNLAQDAEREAKLQERLTSLSGSRLLWMEGEEKHLSVGKDQVSAEYGGSFSVPGLLAGLLTGNKLSVRVSWNRKLYHPADEIRKIRGLKYMVDTIRE